MEAFGVAASALAVTELAAKVVVCCVEYWKKVSSAREDIDNLRKEVDSLAAIAKDVLRLSEEPRGAKLLTAQKPEIETALKEGKSRLKNLEKKLTSSSGKMRHSYGFHAMMWPFEKKEVEAEAQKLRRCGQDIESALQVDQTRIILDVDIKTTLSQLPIALGAAFDSHAEEHNPTCYPNTRVELLEAIGLWFRDPTAKAMFWLNGMAGTGKSTISRTVAGSALAAGYLGASFFFKKGESDRGGASKFVTTIVAQLVSREPMIIPYVQSAIDADRSIIGKSMEKQFEKLLIEPLKKAGEKIEKAAEKIEKAGEKIAKNRILVFVVDALDECDHNDDIGLLIHLFSRAKDLQHYNLKVLLTSRPEIPIRVGFNAPGVEGTYEDLILQQVPRAIIEHDITAFLVAEMEQIRQVYNRSVTIQDQQLPIEWPGKAQIRILVEMAAPLFISAATFCRFIANRNAGNPDRRLEKVLAYQGSTDELKLNATYLPVLTQQTDTLSKEDQKEALKDFRHIIGSIVVLANPLSVSALARLLNINSDEVWDRLDLLHSVLNVPSRAEAPIKLLHPSFRDFLLDQTTSRHSFSVNETETHGCLATDCLRLMQTALRMNICQLQAPEALFADIDPKLISDALRPEVQYACSYWVYHLAQSKKILSDNGEVHKFLINHFLHWLEALSWIGRSWDSLDILDSLQDLVDSDTGSDLTAFLEDARCFASTVIPGVELAPLQVYSSGLLFAPKRSIIRTTFESQIPKWIDLHPEVQDDWDSGMRTLDDHSDSVSSVVFSPDGTIVASASRDMTIRLWNVETGRCMHELNGHSDHVWSVAFSPDNTTLASASKDTTIRLWDPKTGGYTRTLQGHTDFIYSVTFSSNGEFMASASMDQTIRLWKTQTGNLEHTFEGHSDDVFSVAFSLNNDILASASADQTVRLWDLQTGNIEKTMKGHSDYVWSVAFSPNSDIVASASSDKTIRFWDVSTGTHTQTLEHDMGVRLVTFSPNGATLASASVDHTVRLWNTKSCTCYQTFGVGTTLMWRMSFNEDGSSLLTDIGTIAIDGKTQPATPSLTAENTVSSRPASPIQLGHRSGYGIGRDRRWIIQDSCNLLWLPAHIRPDKSAIYGSVIAIGNDSGKVTILRFT